jgi:hypothetical protein
MVFMRMPSPGIHVSSREMADRLAVDERIVEGAGLVVADQPRLEVPTASWNSWSLIDSHAPVVAVVGCRS